MLIARQFLENGIATEAHILVVERTSDLQLRITLAKGTCTVPNIIPFLLMVVEIWYRANCQKLKNPVKQREVVPFR